MADQVFASSQGHVDTTALLRSVVPNGNALTLTLRLSNSEGLPSPSTLSPYLIPKGYVTLDGASLTLIDVSPPEGGRIEGTAGETREEVAGTSAPAKSEVVEFSVMLIKHTQDVIGLSKKKPGELVNVELDVRVDCDRRGRWCKCSQLTNSHTHKYIAF